LTASSGTDYTAVSGTVVFAPGVSSTTVAIPITSTQQIEDNKTFLFTLASPSTGSILGAPSTATVTIINDNPRPILQFLTTSSTASETAGYASFTVTKTWQTTAPASVSYNTSDGSAVAGRDYIMKSGSLSFASSDTSLVILISIVNTNTFQWPRNFTINLSNQSNGASLGANVSETMTISNNIPAPSGLVIVSANYGASGTFSNVRSYITSNISSNTVNMQVSNGTLGGDPSFGHVKTLYVVYENAGGYFKTSVREGGTLLIPDTTQQAIPTSFSTWSSANFSQQDQNDPNVSGETATPAGDGIPNLMKYALNLALMSNGVAGLPLLGTVAINGTNYLTLTYTQSVLESDIGYTVEVSNDLQHWNSGAGYTSVISNSPNPNGLTETIVVQDVNPVGDANSEFMRLKVNGP
jgi:hypothetical protein